VEKNDSKMTSQGEKKVEKGSALAREQGHRGNGSLSAHAKGRKPRGEGGKDSLLGGVSTYGLQESIQLACPRKADHEMLGEKGGEERKRPGRPGRGATSRSPRENQLKSAYRKRKAKGSGRRYSMGRRPSFMFPSTLKKWLRGRDRLQSRSIDCV